MFLHGIEDFEILRGDTLRNPAFFEADGLKNFNCVIANPPFTLKDWSAENWVNDPFGRNIAGVLPKSNGDMAWVQHMVKSMNSTGRMTVVLPHGALFRKGAEGTIRQALIGQDLLEAVIGLGPNIFYGTQLAACVMVFQQNKAPEKKHKVLFIDASDQIRFGRAQNFLEPAHVQQIYSWHQAYQAFQNQDGFCKVVGIDEILSHNASLNMPLYVSNVNTSETKISLDDAVQNWAISSAELKKSMAELFDALT